MAPHFKAILYVYKKNARPGTNQKAHTLSLLNKRGRVACLITGRLLIVYL